LDLDQIVRRLRARVNAQRFVIALQLLFGVPLLVVGPAVFAGLFWFVGPRVGAAVNYATPFWVCLIVVPPILFMLEIASQGRFAEDAAVEYDNDAMRDRASGQMIVLIIFSLLGPGLVLGAWRRLRGQLDHRAAPLDRCAQLLAQLLAADGGVDIFSLQQPGESFDQLLTVIEYLVHYDWAGVGSGGRRVWVLGDGRKVLERGR
jgi:hypothetical protein